MRIKEAREDDKREEVNKDKPRETERILSGMRTTYIEESRIGLAQERKGFHLIEEISRHRHFLFTVKNFTLYI